MTHSSSSDPVLFETLPTTNGMSLGLVTLNAPKTLNALNLPMVSDLLRQLDLWATASSKIAAVILQGAGDKAFCAGGDLHGIYRSMTGAPGDNLGDNVYNRDFFSVEYRLDHRIHTYPKPIVCWADGIVMGGGMGLMMGASHRLVSETSRLAMPEVFIGLYPDVGASWMLNRLPGRAGRFLALTGASIQADDALYAGLADYRIDRADWPALLAALREQPWEHERPINDGLVRRTIAPFTRRSGVSARVSDSAAAVARPSDAAGSCPGLEARVGPLERHAVLIDTLCDQDDLNKIVADLQALAGHDDPWLALAGKSIERACPGSQRLAFSMQQRGKHLSLAHVFELEYAATLACVAHGDLAEGIRALLIDKDKHPRWQPATLAQADEQWVDELLDLSSKEKNT